MDIKPFVNGVPVKTEDVNMSEMKRRLLAEENKRLRECIARVSIRQKILEEMIEVEHGLKAIERLTENKRRVMMTFGLHEADFDTDDNVERNENYLAVIKLLRVANEYWKHQTSNFPKPDSPPEKIRYDLSRPNELAKYRLTVDYDSGLICKKPTMCTTCFGTGHKIHKCPYQTRDSRTAEVKAMIEANIQIHKKEQAYEPTNKNLTKTQKKNRRTRQAKKYYLQNN